MPETQNINMHFHSFFSYNAENWSPSRIAWETKKNGLYAAGLCDFDVLDGLNEFLNACEMLSVRGAVNLETRGFVDELADSDISSPGEPGVTYIMGAGFTSLPEKKSSQADGLNKLKNGAKERNISLIKRIDDAIPEIALDYNEDVLILTPSGNATERHIVSAYINKSEKVFSAKDSLIDFWSEILKLPKNETAQILENRTGMENVVRKKLAKKGGIGYLQPSSETFPEIKVFTDWVKSCGAIPMGAWLDGTSDGEQNADKLLDIITHKGAEALNIIPDRNWNIKDEKTRKLKIQKLDEVIKAAEKRNMPINIGTEMNKKGLPFVDDLNGDVLKNYKRIFLKGADILVGHSVLANFADFPYDGEKAEAEFSDKKEMNQFFESVGALPPIDSQKADKLRQMGKSKAFDEIKKLAEK